MITRRFLTKTFPILVVTSLILLVLGYVTPSIAKDIRIGMSAAFTGPSRGLGIELFRGSMACFAQVNENGGLFGRNIKVIAYDDGYNPVPTIHNTIRLVEEDDVLLLFNFVGTPTVTRMLPLLKAYNAQRDLFLFFPFSGAQPQREGPYGEYVFNLRASYSQEIDALVNYLISLGRSRIAVFYQIDAYGRSGHEAVLKSLSKRGLRVVGEATYHRGTAYDTSMQPQVKTIRSSSPDSIIAIGAYAACAAFIRDSRDAGLNFPIANVSFVDSENMLKLLLKTGAQTGTDYTANLINSQVVPSYDRTELPAVAEYREMITRYDEMPPKSLTQQPYERHLYSPVSLEGFLNAKLLVEILKRLGPDLHPKIIKSVVESMKEYDLGIGVPISFGPNRHQGLDKVFLTTVEEGRFVPIAEREEREH
ncbi:MAG: ABC transporter substrate-binding protein [Deltaproteobacteria bacterium]|nr:ABC transporter substrate-binding protein [Deltaproteobacteria bacterium]